MSMMEIHVKCDNRDATTPPAAKYADPLFQPEPQQNAHVVQGIINKYLCLRFCSFVVNNSLILSPSSEGVRSFVMRSIIVQD